MSKSMAKLYRKTGTLRSVMQKFNCSRATARAGVVCGNNDLRVLALNHINGAGAKTRRQLYSQLVAFLQGGAVPFLEVRRANCNILHEYERGNRIDSRGMIHARIARDRNLQDCIYGS